MNGSPLPPPAEAAPAASPSAPAAPAPSGESAAGSSATHWLRWLGLLAFVGGLWALPTDLGTGARWLVIGIIGAILDHLDESAATAGCPLAPGRIVRLGQVGWYLGFALFVGQWFWLAVPVWVATAALAGREPLRGWWHAIRREAVDIRGDRWVNLIGWLLIGGGALTLVFPLLRALGIGQRPLTPRDAGVLLVALPLIATGVGMLRRALWAGILGLCFTFFSLIQSINAAFSATGGDLTQLPLALLANSPAIAINWLLFFGFYSVFYPLLTARDERRSGSLQTQLAAADQQLAAARADLDAVAVVARRTASDLENERRRLLAVFENLNEGVVLLDPDLRVTWLNPAMAHLLDLRAEEWLGRAWPGVAALPGVTALSSQEGTLEWQRNGQRQTWRGPVGGEAGWADHRGEIRRRFAWYSQVIADPEGECLAVFILVRDVTVAREIERMKTEFVSNVSHELRTPLTSIRAYTEMLIDDESGDEQTRREYLEIILHESERLTNLVNDILDLSKMESGRKEAEFRRCSLADLITQVIAVMQSAADQKRQTLQVTLPDGGGGAAGDGQVVGDPDLLHQAVLNLVGNAVKYTPVGGRIEVRASFAAGRYRIEVRDNGPGISRPDQERLFTKFYRVENTLNRDIGGTGLGLAMVRQIAHLHRGTATVESEPGRGSTFAIDLPLDPGDAPG